MIQFFKGIRIAEAKAGHHCASAKGQKGELFVWGSLGDDRREPIKTPLRVLEDEVIADFAMSQSALIVVTGTGYAFIQGRIKFEEYVEATKICIFKELMNYFITRVTAGANHILFLTKEGEIVGVGNSERGQLATPKKFVYSGTPLSDSNKKVEELWKIKIPTEGKVGCLLLFTLLSI